MKVIALVGSSGTGKSHKAMKVAYDNNLEFIVDDGLLIEGTKKLAGSSAKRENTKITAVKRALFFDEAHRQAVVDILKQNPHKNVLLLGTSNEMVEKIAKTLGLSGIDRIIRIEDVATNEEIKIALHMRKDHGKHVVPLPAMEIKQDFSGYFRDTLKTFLHRKDSDVLIGEKTVVRPTFSYRGRYTISNKTLVQIVTAVGGDVKGIYKVLRVSVDRYPDGVIMAIEVSIEADAGRSIVDLISVFQKSIVDMMEHMTMINVLKANVYVRSVRIR